MRKPDAHVYFAVALIVGLLAGVQAVAGQQRTIDEISEPATIGTQLPAGTTVVAGTGAGTVAASSLPSPAPVVRITPQIQATDTLPPPPEPIVWGLSGTTDTSRCTQFEPMLTELAPPAGWDVVKMSKLMRRESGCCPQVATLSFPTSTTWRELRGGDVATEACQFLRVASTSHRSDTGLLQINGINYDRARCGSSCVIHATQAELGDPVTNIQAAADLCQWWVDNGSSCYQPWGTS